jgi:hypothetical protein
LFAISAIPDFQCGVDIGALAHRQSKAGIPNPELRLTRAKLAISNGTEHVGDELKR